MTRIPELEPVAWPHNLSQPKLVDFFATYRLMKIEHPEWFETEDSVLNQWLGGLFLTLTEGLAHETGISLVNAYGSVLNLIGHNLYTWAFYQLQEGQPLHGHPESEVVALGLRAMVSDVEVFPQDSLGSQNMAILIRWLEANPQNFPLARGNPVDIIFGQSNR